MSSPRSAIWYTEDDHDTRGHFTVPTAGPCWHCGQLTCWVDESFVAYLHPGPCANAKWAEYWRAEQLEVRRVYLRNLRAGRGWNGSWELP